jgi:hypothetical protein
MRSERFQTVSYKYVEEVYLFIIIIKNPRDMRPPRDLNLSVK